MVLKMPFKATIGTANMPLFKEAIKLLKGINDSEMSIRVAGDLVSMGQYAKSKSEAGIISFHADFFEADSYVNDNEEAITFSMDTNIFSRAIGRFKEVDIIYDGKLILSHGKKKMVLPSYMPEMEWPDGLQGYEPANVFKVPNDFIIESIKDMMVDNHSTYVPVILNLVSKKLTISRNTDLVQTAENYIELEIDEEAIASASISADGFAKIITGVARRISESRIGLESEKPVRIDYIFPEGVKMTFGLAPYQGTPTAGEEDFDDDRELSESEEESTEEEWED